MGQTLTFFLRGHLERRRPFLKGISALKEAGKRIEQRLGDYLSLWRTRDRIYVVKKQRHSGRKFDRKARTI